MIQNCPHCEKTFDNLKDKLCRDCYDLIIFKGQCLNIAGTIVAGMMADSTFEIKQDKLSETIFTIAEKLYEDGKTRGWVKDGQKK